MGEEETRYPMTVETVIQNIVLPIAEYEGARSLYIKDYNGDFPITISKGESIDLRTYFNLFPSEKYRKYANLDHVMLRLDCEGNPDIEIFRYGTGSYNTESMVYDNEIRIELHDECLLGIVITASLTDVTIHNGCFYTNKGDINDIHLAHVMCTYRREKDITNKLDWICSKCEQDPLLRECLTVYVIDNGRTLDYQNESVKVIPSPNLGGSGGFSRGMIEAVNDGVSTHVTLNDDDAMLDPETIHRSIAFYRLIVKERKEIVLGGTIFRRDEPTIVHEAGAYYKDGGIRSNCGMDSTTTEGCLKLERALCGDEEGSYFAWCYMTMPCDVIRRNGFSLPLFFQFDDIDYSLRIKGIPKVTMCGICVWHAFVNTFSVNKMYFGIRNMLVTAASNSLLNRNTMKKAFFDVMINVGFYRYPTAEAQLQALRDIRNGPDKVFEMITRGYLLFTEYKYDEPVSDKKLTTRHINHGMLFKCLTLNGVLFPSIGDYETDMSDWEVYHYYRKGRVFYKSEDGRETVCERSAVRTISLTLRVLWNIGMILMRKGKINRLYSDASKKYSSEINWQRLFGTE